MDEVEIPNHFRGDFQSIGLCKAEGIVSLWAYVYPHNIESGSMIADRCGTRAAE